MQQAILTIQESNHQSIGISMVSGAATAQVPAVDAELVRAFLRSEVDLIGQENNTIVWDPACGEGAIGRVLEEAGITVFGSDRGNTTFGIPAVDFLASDVRLADMAISCPPSNQVAEYVRHALHHLQLGYIAFLVETEFWQTSSGVALSRDLPPTFAYLSTLGTEIRGRHIAAGGAMWCVWLGLWRGATELRFLTQPGARS